MSAHHTAETIRSRLGHPVIDSDGHWIEFEPLALDSFGQALRKNFREAGLYEMLEKRTVAMATCFPEAPSGEATKWMRKTGPRAEWRRFSSDWVKRMIDAMRPRAVLVFGQKAATALGLTWRDAKDQPCRGMVFGRAEVEGCPAVYCHHLSQGWKKDEVQACLAEVKRIVDADKARSQFT